MFKTISAKLQIMIVAAFLVTIIGVLIILSQLASGLSKDVSDIIMNAESRAFESRLQVIYNQIETAHKTLKKQVQQQGVQGTQRAKEMEKQVQETLLAEMAEKFYGKNNAKLDKNTVYPFIVDKQGIGMMHPHLERGHDLSALPFAEQMTSAKDPFFGYHFQGVDKFMFVKAYPEWNWVVGFALDQKTMLAPVKKVEKSMTGFQLVILGFLVAIALVLNVILVFFIRALFTRPLKQAELALKDISEGDGDLTARLEVKREDEVGKMAIYFNAFVEKLQRIIGEIAENTAHLAATSQELAANASEMTEGSQNMNSQSTSAASAVEQLSSNLTNISSGAEEMSSTVSTVASAIEEMSASLSEVAKNCADGARMSSEADGKSRAAGNTMNTLNASAEEIGKVIETISDIANQTNLLALNATIEAASAGEAGKGFAVVANEVKELAKQTAQATEEIERLINEMQDKTGDAVKATSAISETIGGLNSTVQTIAGAVEEQSATTNEIAQNIGGASQAATDISRNIQEASTGSNEISQSIQGVQLSAQGVNAGAQQTNTSSAELAEMAARLQALTGQFKV